MIFRNDMEFFFRTLSRLSGEGRRFFFVINYAMTEGMLLELELGEGGALVASPAREAIQPEVEPSVAFDFGYARFDSAPRRGAAPHTLHTPHVPHTLVPHPEPLARYAERFEVVQEALGAGRISLVNLTLATPIECGLSLEEIYHTSRARYKVLVRDHFVCFSPERFIRIDGAGILSAHPMKGTISTAIPDAARVILEDPKELAEHTYMVEAMKAELSRVGQKVSVPRFRYLDEIHTEGGGLLQVSSEVRAELAPDWRAHLGELLQTLLPAGSITGVPKGPAMQVIERAEQHDRGYYSGISGYFDGEALETSVLIRFIEQRADGTLLFHSGGGVTIDSACGREYNEVVEKIYLPPQ